MMDPNLLRFLASGAYPSPLPSPQESFNMFFPLPRSNQQLIQQQQELVLRQQLLACQQLLYQQACSNFLVPSVPPLKAVSPTVSAPPPPQQLIFPAKFTEVVAVSVTKQQDDNEPPPRLSPVNHLTKAGQCLGTALASPTVSLISSPDSPNLAGSQEGHCTSPSTSSQNKDDEEEDLFVDVESVDNKIANKDRRKAHVEFFRKVKSIRQRAVVDPNGEPSLECAICQERVPMQDNAIQLHVNIHAEAGGFRCQLCGFELKEKFKVYKHMREKHPNKVDLIEDRRNMNKLSAYIEVVFPRGVAKAKKDSTKEVESLIRRLEEKKMPQVSCSICKKMVASTKSTLTRHAGSHPWYRCKTCKFTTDNETDQEQHQTSEHSVIAPHLTVEYNLCTAIDVVVRQVSRCFSHALQ